MTIAGAGCPAASALPPTCARTVSPLGWTACTGSGWGEEALEAVVALTQAPRPNPRTNQPDAPARPVHCRARAGRHRACADCCWPRAVDSKACLTTRTRSTAHCKPCMFWDPDGLVKALAVDHIPIRQGLAPTARPPQQLGGLTLERKQVPVDTSTFKRPCPASTPWATSTPTQAKTPVGLRLSRSHHGRPCRPGLAQARRAPTPAVHHHQHGPAPAPGRYSEQRPACCCPRLAFQRFTSLYNGAFAGVLALHICGFD